MKAVLEPLYGKYYGTKISLYTKGIIAESITLWFDNWGTYIVGCPSPRELDGGCSCLDWVDNVWLSDTIWAETDQKGCWARDYYEVCDSHYENLTTYLAALKIVDAFNGTHESDEIQILHDELRKKYYKD